MFGRLMFSLVLFSPKSKSYDLLGKYFLWEWDRTLFGTGRLVNSSKSSYCLRSYTYFLHMNYLVTGKFNPESSRKVRNFSLKQANNKLSAIFSKSSSFKILFVCLFFFLLFLSTSQIGVEGFDRKTRLVEFLLEFQNHS